MSTQNQPNVCPNCGQPPGTDSFCPHCGQKNRLPKLRVGSVLSEFFSVVFSLDNQFFRTVKAALLPARLPQEYIAGKRKKYLQPFRFFFYAWLLMALTNQLDNDSSNSPPSQNLIRQQLEANEKLKNDTSSTAADRSLSINDIRVGLLDLSFTMDSSAAKSKGIIYLGDLERLPMDSLIAKYHITSTPQKIFLSQAKKFNKSPDALGNYILNHFVWVVFAMIPFSSLLLWLIFRRKRPYYVEHFVYELYIFGFIFIFISFINVVYFTPLPNAISLIIPVFLPLSMAVYSFLSFKNFYNKSIFSALILWLLYLFFNFLIFVLFLALYVFISFVTF